MSRRIDMLRFALIAGLVLLHYGMYPSLELSPFRGFQDSPYPVAVFVNSFVLFFFFCAVPLLSAISGWLFFKGFEQSARFYTRRIRRRARSILLPMIVWNGLILAGFIAAAALVPEQLNDASVDYDVTRLAPDSFVNALLGVTRNPVGFHFWFLRDLFVAVLISPLIGLAMLRAPIVGALICFAGWAAGYDFEIFHRPDVLLFFYLGGLARLKGIRVEACSPRLGGVLLVLFTALVAARTAGPYWIPEQSALGVVLFEYGTRLMRIVGVAAIWLVSGALVDTWAGRASARLGPLAFFVYASHWPLNQLVKHAFDAALPWRNEAVLLANYLATAALTIGLSLLLARVLKAGAPGLFDVLSGGRSLSEATRSRTRARSVPEVP